MFLRKIIYPVFLFFALNFSVSANDLWPQYPFPNSTSGPHYTGQPITVEFQIYFAYNYPVNASEWYVLVEIICDDVTVFTSTVPGVDRNSGQIIGALNMSVETPYISEVPGNCDIIITVNYRYDINQNNDVCSDNFTVYGEPDLISGITPSSGSTVDYSPAQSFSWTNGSSPITNTIAVLSPVTPGSVPSITQTIGSPFNSFTPQDDLFPSTQYQLNIIQENPGGQTTNGPFNYTTRDEPCSPPVTITYPENGATDILYYPPPNVEWTSSTNTGAQGFDVFMGNTLSDVDPNTAIPITNTLPGVTSFPVPDNLLGANRDVYVRIGTSCPDGTSYSDITTFTFGDRHCPQTPSILFPENGSLNVPHSPFVPIEIVSLDLTSSEPVRTNIFVGTSESSVDPSTSSPITNTVNFGQTIFPITGLQPGQDYFARATFECGDGEDQNTIVGGVSTFRTAEGTNISGSVRKTYALSSSEFQVDSFFDVFVEIQVPVNDNQTAGVQKETQVDNEGNFSFENLPPGDYTVGIRTPDGWTYVTPSGGVYQGTITPGQDIIDLPFILIPPPSEITGEKWKDDNSDGIKDNNEERLSDWQIFLNGTSFAGNTVSMATSTGSNGAYKFENVPPGNYSVTEGEVEGWFQIFPSSGGHNLSNIDDGINYEFIDFGNAPPGQICGRKIHDRNGNGIREVDEVGLDGVLIKLYKGGVLIAQQLTYSDDLNGDGVIDPRTESGFFCFTNLEPAFYIVEEEVPRGWAQTAPSNPDHFEIELLPGMQVSNLLFGNRCDEFDFGDLPEPIDPVAGCLLGQCYPTLLPLGAYHAAIGPMLGNVRDTELNGQPDFFAMGDDTTNFDEDGVRFIIFEPGGNGRVQVTITGANEDFPCYLSAWIDFDGDGFLGTGILSPGENILLAEKINAAGTYSFEFDVPADVPNGGYARFRLGTSEQSVQFPFGGALDGEVEDYIAIGLDYGDAPDSSFEEYPDLPFGYPTKLVDNGARHIPISTIRLGAIITDGDNDGQPGPLANGDDNENRPDEDGIEFGDGFVTIYRGPDPDNGNRNLTIYGIIREATAKLKPLASISGYLNAWIDFNGDGIWNDEDEHIFKNEPVQPGPNYTTLSFDVPMDEYAGGTYARFRFSTQTDLKPTGPAVNGEVEDYLILILFPLDFGDAPDPYSTLSANGGAKHIIGSYYLGEIIDADGDGQPDADALGDDNSNLDDEDGVIFLTQLVKSKEAEVEIFVNAPAGQAGFLNAWIDYNQDGIWDPVKESIASDKQLFAGLDTLRFTVPDTASKGTSFARFRFADNRGVGPDDNVNFENVMLLVGEVEDYLVVIDSLSVSVDDGISFIPTEFKLHQNYPNPFNPVTTITYDVVKAAHVHLVVYNILGQRLAVMVNETKAPGRYHALFGTEGLPSGIYIYQIEMGDYIKTMKMILMK